MFQVQAIWEISDGTSFRPKVFAEGKYTVRIGEGDGVKTVTGIEAIGPDVRRTIEVAL